MRISVFEKRSEEGEICFDAYYCDVMPIRSLLDFCHFVERILGYRVVCLELI